MALFSKFFGRTISDAAGFALGGAMRSPLEPPLVELTNNTWKEFVSAGITVPTEPNDAAQIVAENVAEEDWAKDQAAQRGYGSDQMDKLIKSTRNAPGLGELLRMWRRGTITDKDFTHGLRKARLETLWDPGLRNLKTQYLDPAVIALGIVRDTIPDPGLQTGAHSTAGSDIPQGQQFPGDVLAEFEAAGVDEARARVMVDNIGLPMPPVRAANAFFRGIINKASYYLSVAQSDSRPAWADAILEEAREILTAHDWVELELRGWIKRDERLAGTRLHGMSDEDSDRMFLVLGRPMTHRNVFLAQRRGGVYGETPADIDPAFLKSLQESNERPEWYGLEWAMRFSQPSVFVIRQWLKDGGDPEWARTKLFYEGWEEGDIDKFVTEYAPSGTAPTTKHKQFTYSQIHQAWRHSVFGTGATNDQIALSELEQIGYSPTQAQTLLNTWKATPASTSTA